MKTLLTVRRLLIVVIFVAIGITLSAQSPNGQEEPKDAALQYQLGARYLYGVTVPQDNEQAFNWFCKSAEQGHGRAQLKIGLFYCNGIVVEQDYNVAAKMFREALEQGTIMYEEDKHFFKIDYEKLSLAEPQAQRCILSIETNKNLDYYFQNEYYDEDLDIEEQYQYMNKALSALLKEYKICLHSDDEYITEDSEQMMKNLKRIDANVIKEFVSSPACQISTRDCQMLLQEKALYYFQNRMMEETLSCVEKILDLSIENNFYDDFFENALGDLYRLNRYDLFVDKFDGIDYKFISSKPQVLRVINFYKGLCYISNGSLEEALPLLEQSVDISKKNNLVDGILLDALNNILFIRNSNNTIDVFHVLIDSVMEELDGFYDNDIIAGLLVLQSEAEPDSVKRHELLTRAKDKYDNSYLEHGKLYIECCNRLARLLLNNKEIDAAYWCLTNMIIECEDTFDSYTDEALATFNVLKDVYLAQGDSVMADRVFYTKIIRYALMAADDIPDLSDDESKKKVKVAQGYYYLLMGEYDDDLDAEAINFRILMGNNVSPVYYDLAHMCYANAIEKAQDKQIDCDLTSAFLGILDIAIAYNNITDLNEYMPRAVDYARKINNDLINEADLYYRYGFFLLSYYFISKDFYCNYLQLSKHYLHLARDARPPKNVALIIDLLSAVVKYVDNTQEQTKKTVDDALQKVMNSNISEEEKENLKSCIEQWKEQIKNDLKNRDNDK